MPHGWGTEAQVSVTRGANSGLSPALIGVDQVWRAVNCSTRTGRLRTRPKWVRRKTLYRGLPQGASFFKHTNTIVLSIGGRIINVDPRDWSMYLLTTEESRNASTNPYAWFCETEGAMVIQDGRSWPFVYDGYQLTRYDHGEGYTLPIGQAMAYGNGRLAVAAARGRVLRIGDIHDRPLSELSFTETAYLSGGGDISWHSPIKALTHMPVADTSTGKGPLIVGLRDEMWAVRTDITARDSWQTVDGFVTMVFSQHGITGPNAHAQVNQDIYFRAIDGIRSLRMTVADYQSAGFTPVSREVAYRVDYDTEWMLDGASAAYFDNRLLMTHSPKLIDNIRPVHGGLVALNFDMLSSLGSKLAPAFDGEWEGPDIVQLIPAVVDDEPRMFALCREGVANTLWEMLPERTRTVSTVGGTYAVNHPRSIVETRMYYADDPRSMKELMRIDLWLERIRGYCSLTVKFRAEGATDWTDIETFAFNNESDTEQSRGPIFTKKPAQTTDVLRQRPANLGNGFQFRFEWCGDMGLAMWSPNMEPRTVPGNQQHQTDGDLSGEACDVEMPDAPTNIPISNASEQTWIEFLTQ